MGMCGGPVLNARGLCIGATEGLVPADGVLQCVVRVLQRVTVCYSVLQCVAVCCIVVALCSTRAAGVLVLRRVLSLPMAR